EPARGRGEPREGGAGQIQAARPPLADPARPLHLRGAAPAVREVPDQRSLPLAGEDGVAAVRGSSVGSSPSRDPTPASCVGSREGSTQPTDAYGCRLWALSHRPRIAAAARGFVAPTGMT